MPLSTPSGIFKAYDIRGLLGEEIDGDLAEQIGRAFARVLGDLRDKAPGELRIGLGRDMREGAAELSDRYRDGLMAEGAHVLDAGLVGTEMLYFLVGSHGLDGGLMCTASHNPRAYTGAKLVREGGRALSGEAGIGEVAALVAGGLPDDAPGGGSVERVDIAPAYHTRLRTFVDRAALRPLRIVLDGGSGMAAHTIGPVLDELPGLDLVRTSWEPDGAFPDHEPNPLLEENRRAICEAVRSEGADLGIAFDGDADRCFFIDENGRFVDGDFLCALLARQVLAMRPGAAIVYDVRASWAVPDTVRAAGGVPHVNRSGTRSSRRACTSSAACSAARCPATTTSPTSTTRTPARAGAAPAPAARQLGADAVRAARALPHPLLHLRRAQLGGGRPARQARRDPRALRRRGPDRARRRVRGVRGLALQRALLEHGAAHAAVPGEPRLPRAHGAAARRGAGRPALVIHVLPIPTPFRVGRVNCHLIEDDPLTLVDTGPNSGMALDELEQALAAHGRRVEDLERIVITHQHIDHLGLVGILARRSGAEVCALDVLAPVVEDHAAAAERDDELAEGLMLRHGIPSDVVMALRSVSLAFRAWGGSAPVDRPLADGGELEWAGRRMHVLHRPGHSPSDTVSSTRSAGSPSAATT